jgi:hypothetical protein
MRAFVLALAAIGISLPAGAADRPYQLAPRHKADIVRQVKDRMNDGESARWRWPLHQPEFGTYCAWFNAKNQLGAYTGWTPFLVIGGVGGGPKSTGQFDVIQAEIGNPDIVARMCADAGYDLSAGPPPE